MTLQHIREGWIRGFLPLTKCHLLYDLLNTKHFQFDL